MTTSDGTSNYRDVGEALGLWLDPSPIRSGALLRGGKLDTLTTAAEIGHPRTILNLRQGPDPRQLEGVTYLHVPAANEVENYDTTLREVRVWLGKALAVLAHPDTAWPVYVHCTSGRDRTGLVVASTLFFLGFPRDVIVEEFLLSEGAERSLIEGALAGIANAQAPLRVDRRGLEAALLRPAGTGAHSLADVCARVAAILSPSNETGRRPAERAFEYVGPEAIRAGSRDAPRGTAIGSSAAMVRWLSDHADAEEGWATYVVSRDGELVVAPRRSEHVACAGGEAVLAAGEIRFSATGAVVAVTNNSTGYCPSEDCWEAVRSALDRAGLSRPDGFTFVAVFRRCTRCGERNLVKEGWFVCAMCDADLPGEWNLGPEGGQR